MKCFPKLNQTHVRIEAADGKVLSVAMLPVKALDEFREIRAMLKNVKDEAGLNEIKKRLIELVSQSIPLEYQINLPRFDIQRLVELAAYLMFGDEDDQPPKDAEEGGEKKEGDGQAEKKSC